MPRLYFLRPTSTCAPQPLLSDDSHSFEFTIMGRVTAFIEGILADNEVNASEASALLAMLERPDHAVSQRGFPLSTLLYRVRRLAEDGVWTPEELAELRDCLQAFIDPNVEAIRPVGIIFNDPAPQIEFAGRVFVVTGTFAFGDRKLVEAAITERGGSIKKAVSSHTDYVLVGSFISGGWLGGNYGTKIIDGASARDRGEKTAIISEHHWQAHL